MYLMCFLDVYTVIYGKRDSVIMSEQIVFLFISSRRFLLSCIYFT